MEIQLSPLSEHESGLAVYHRIQKLLIVKPQKKKGGGVGRARSFMTWTLHMQMQTNSYGYNA